MIKVTATSLIHSISPVLQVTERFQKRELVLNDSWEKDGQYHPNFIVIEFSGDKMAQLDGFNPGDRVTVEAIINGREYNGRIFNTIKGQKIELYQPQQQQSRQPQQTQYQQGYYPPASAPQAQYPPASPPQYWDSNPQGGVNNLPFQR